MDSEIKCWCRNCGIELPPSHTGLCPHCGKTGKDCKATATAVLGIDVSGSSRARKKREGTGKFVKEILQGRFPSKSPALKKGVYKERIVDKEKNEYHETVKDATTGEVIRDIHEPLSQHKHQPKQRIKKVKG